MSQESGALRSLMVLARVKPCARELAGSAAGRRAAGAYHEQPLHGRCFVLPVKELSAQGIQPIYSTDL